MTVHQTGAGRGIGIDRSGRGFRLTTPESRSAGATVVGEPKGVIYTREWIVDLILDLAGYVPAEDLAVRHAIEPASGEGAFLLPMIRRLLDSLERYGRSPAEAKCALKAYEVDVHSACHVIDLAIEELRRRGVDTRTARSIAEGWVTVGDYLLQSGRNRKADFVIGNPPYIRYDDLPERSLAIYRRLYPTMVGRSDIYVGFIEAGLRQLSEGGVLGFICADRWMRSAYGAELRRLVAQHFSVDVVIEMHDAPAFETAVSAYPAVVVIRRSPQDKVLVAHAGSASGATPVDSTIASALLALADGRDVTLQGFTAGHAPRWFSGHTPWPSVMPRELAVLQRLEEQFSPLEDTRTGTTVGIGVATGNDRVFITMDKMIVEPDRLVPLAMATDTRTGQLQWSGHYLIDPWQDGNGLVDLGLYPLLRRHFEYHYEELIRRNIAKRHVRDWYRTIDRVNHKLVRKQKLYFPDLKLMINPALDCGETYPHHNLYYLTSERWDLEVLGGLLLSRVAQFFIEAYCVKMRGGTLRFQAQYLRRIRVPDPYAIPGDVQDRLRSAFRSRNVDEATDGAVAAYGIEDLRRTFQC